MESFHASYSLYDSSIQFLKYLSNTIWKRTAAACYLLAGQVELLLARTGLPPGAITGTPANPSPGFLLPQPPALQAS